MHLVLCLLVLCVSLFAEEQEFKQAYVPSSSLASTSGLLPTFVNGSVCVITGEYVDSGVDLVCQGPEPLILERNYSSGNHSSSYLCTSWQLNYPCMIEADRHATVNRNYFTATVQQPSGSMLSYKSKQRKGKDDFYFDLNVTKGLTNCSRGAISARTNLKNQTVAFTEHKRCAVVTMPNIDKCIYRSFKEEKEWERYFFLTQIQKLNGSSIFVNYNNDKNHLKCFPEQIFGKVGKLVYAQIFLERPERKRFKHHPTISVKASSGQSVKYHFEEGHDNSFYLTHVETPHKPHEKYHYISNDKQECRIAKKEWPKGRYIKNEYYAKGSNPLPFDQISLKKDDFQINRVMTQSNPYGITHSFVYSKQEGNGITDVYDSSTHKTTYKYNSEDRLTKLKKWKGTHKKGFELYSTEHFIWGKDEQDCHLMGKYLVDQNDHLHSGRFFEYDTYGNILVEKFYGKLTGTTGRPTIKNHHPSGEHYTKSYTYSNDEWHLLLGEAEENGRKIFYRYKPGTDLISAKYLVDNDQIKLRQFTEYNEAGLVTSSIIDDGNTFEEHSLAGATERRITRIFPRMSAPVGVPERVDELVLNVATGTEEFLHRTLSAYSLEGHLLKQDHYDNVGVYQYTLSWEYDAHGNITKETNAMGVTITRKYDENDNLVDEQGPGLHKAYTYDLCNRLIKEETLTEYGPLIKRYQYNQIGNLEKSTDSFGNETKFKQDEFGRVISKTLPKVIDEREETIHPEIKMEYDIANHLTASTDPRGNTIRTTYNAWGKPLEMQYPDGTSERKTYKKDGSLWQTFSPNGLISCYEHDYQGRVISDTQHEADSKLIHGTYHTYSAFHLLSSTDPAGLTTHHQYDARGRLISTLVGDRKTTYTYDTLNRIAFTAQWITPQEALIKTFEYDHLNRVTKEATQDLKGSPISKAEYLYDARGNRIQRVTTSQAGISIERTEYDSLNQPTKIIDALGNTTVILYDYFHPTPLGNVLKVTTIDPLGNQVIEVHDTHQRVALIEHKNAVNITIAKQVIIYDTAGNKVKDVHTPIIDGKDFPAIITQWEYNSVNQVIHQIDACGALEQKDTYYHYNASGQKSALTKPDGKQVTYTYDSQGRLSLQQGEDFAYSYAYDHQHHPIAITDLKTKTVTKREYNLYGDLLKETLPSGHTITSTYDALGRRESLTLPDQSQISYTHDAAHLKTIQRNDQIHTYVSYDSAGSLLESHLMNDSNITYQYDLLNRPTQMKTKTFTQQNIDYDALGNLIKTNTLDPTGKLNKTFTYDDLSHLKAETGISSHTYKTDSLHNRRAKNEIPYSVNALNQLTDQAGIQYHYDADGNLIYKKEKEKKTTYQYDGLDRLVAVLGEDEETTYTYDGFNRRISKTQHGKTTHYLYQEQNEIGAILDNDITELRILGIGNGAEIGAAVALEINHKTYIPIHDQHGNITVLLDQHSKVIETYRYTAFGEEEIYTDNTKTTHSINPWRFASKRHDPETGYIYFGNRYYDPEIGRWITKDPLGFVDGPNLYAYLHHNPLKSCDLYGLFEFNHETGLDKIVNAVNSLSKPYQHVNNDHPPTNYDWSVKKEVSFDHPRIKYYNFEKEHYTPNGPSRLFDLRAEGRKELPRWLEISNINGIQNTFQSAQKGSLYLSDLSGGYNIAGIYNTSYDFDLDVLQCSLNLDFLATEPVSRLHQQWDSFFDRSSANYLQICHSGGAIHVRNALLDYPVKLRQRIFVVAIAPGGYVYPESCAKVFHYRAHACRDGVPRLDWWGALRAKKTIRTLDSHPDAKRWDHEFMSPTYREPLEQHLQNYIASQGRKI